MARKKTPGRVASADSRAAKPIAMLTVTERDVARRAYELYLARGGEHGYDVDDWLRAEHELRGIVGSNAA